MGFKEQLAACEKEGARNRSVIEGLRATIKHYRIPADYVNATAARYVVRYGGKQRTCLGVLRLFGLFHAITPFGIVVGVLLTALYFAAFRSGITGRTRWKAVTEQEVPAWIEGREEDVLQPAA